MTKMQGRGKKVEGIRNPEGWTMAAYRSGKFDEIIEKFYNDEPDMYKVPSHVIDGFREKARPQNRNESLEVSRVQRSNPTDETTRICETLKHELLAIVSSLMNETSTSEGAPAPMWMTAAQLAEYWQLVGEDGKPRTAGILKWVKRSPDEFPLPHAYMGDLLRFHREDVDTWAKQEAERRRIQNERKRLKIA
jgi:hypothetical protein